MRETAEYRSGMRVWILGAGTLGVLVARHLRRELHDVVMIERDPVAADEALRKVDCYVEICDGTDLPALRRLSIDRADCFIAITGSDEVNMVVSGLVAQAFRTPLKIARVRNPHYAAGIAGAPELFGIDHVLNPEIETASAVLRALEHGAVGQVAAFRSTSHSLREIRVTPGGGLDGACVFELAAESPHRFIAPVLSRDHDYNVVVGGTRLRGNDILYVFSGPDAFDALCAKDGGEVPSRRGRTLVVGGSLIGVTVAEALLIDRDAGGPDGQDLGLVPRMLRRLQRRISGPVTIVEPSEKRCEEIRHLVPAAEIITADIRDEARLGREEYARHDVVVAAGIDQQANIVAALQAKTQGVERAIAVLFHEGYARIARNLGVDVPISIKGCMANAIAAHMRGEAVRALYTIPGSAISIVEAVLAAESAFNGVPLKHAGLPKRSLILSISRDGIEIIPAGDEAMRAGDMVVALTPRENEGVLIHLLRATRYQPRLYSV